VRLTKGTTFGRFLIEGMLGEGGMGTVYQAVDTKLERRVAVKLLSVDPDAGDAARSRGAARLLREARAAAAIDHPNAIAIHDVGEVDDTAYISMELVKGQSLRTYVGDTSVPIATRVRWLTDVARALAAAHAIGVVHRDVKPENVMVRDDGSIKVLDFGIARIAGDDEVERPLASTDDVIDAWRVTLTTCKSFVGTPRYMAPEQLHGERVDGRADQFAWGVMAYELLAGVPPWRGETMSLVTLVGVLESEPPPLRDAAPAVSASVARVVHRALAKTPSERFASMHEVDEALAPPRSARGRPWIAGIAGIAAMGALALVTVRRVPEPAAALLQAAPLAPSAIAPSEDPPHVVLRLDASQGVVHSGDVVQSWIDQSGNGNDAIAGALAPSFVEDAIAGLPALHFDGGRHMKIADAPSLRVGSEEFVVEVVARHTRALPKDMTAYGMTDGYGLLFAKTEAPDPYFGIALMVNYPHPEPSTKLGVQTSYVTYALSTTERLNDGRPHLFGARRTGGVLEARVDGVAEATVPSVTEDVSAPGRPAFIGAQPQSRGIIQQLQGDIAAIVLVRGPFTPRYFEKFEADMMARYGIR
jgi:serine/threonine-protein kinase